VCGVEVLGEDYKPTTGAEEGQNPCFIVFIGKEHVEKKRRSCFDFQIYSFQDFPAIFSQINTESVADYLWNSTSGLNLGNVSEDVNSAKHGRTSSPYDIAL